MRQKFVTAVFISLFLAAPALAGPSPDDIRTALAEPVAINGVSLDRDDLKKFYDARDDRPVWHFSGEENAAAFNAFEGSLEDMVTYHGLRREDYNLDEMRKLAAAGDDADRLKLEILVSGDLLQLARDLHGDGVDLTSLYPGWDFERGDVDIPNGLAAAVANGGVNDYMDGLTPKNPDYRALAASLRLYRERAASGGWNAIDPGPALKPGARGPRVAQLRARLAAENYGATLEDKKAAAQFDKGLQEALKTYQSRNGLDVDGHVGGKTLAALNVPISTRIEQIRANMERWRHMPEDFPPARYALVNIPDQSILIVENGAPVYSGPVIVGQIERKTPFIDSVIRSMIVNPSWHVPKSIARKDILPKLRDDPHYLEKMGIVIRDNNGDPYGENVDWKDMQDEDFDFKLRQEPGSKNSLGRLKFDFDNDFAVYMHGTPHQELFKKYDRTFSSGCVRLSDPVKVAEILLAGAPGNWDEAHIESAIDAQKTKWVGIANPMPVYFLYWTVFPSADGNIQFRPDVYSYDDILIKTINGEPIPENSVSDAK